MATNLRQYDPPVVVDRITRLPARSGALPPPGSPGAPFQGCIEVEGRYSCYDVHIQVPPEWLDVTLRVVNESGSVQEVLDLKAIADLPIYYQQGFAQGVVTPSPAPFNALAFAIRGRQCDKLRVEAYHTNADHPNAKFRVQAWGQDGVYGDRSNVLPVQPFGAMTQQLYAAQELTNAAGEEIDFLTNGGASLRVNPTGGRIDLTRISIAHDEDFPVTYTLTDLADGDGSPTTRGLFLVHQGAQYVEEFTYPLRGRPRGVWSIQATNATDPSVHRINTTGILE